MAPLTRAAPRPTTSAPRIVSGTGHGRTGARWTFASRSIWRTARRGVGDRSKERPGWCCAPPSYYARVPPSSGGGEIARLSFIDCLREHVDDLAVQRSVVGRGEANKPSVEIVGKPYVELLHGPMMGVYWPHI